ncbi:MAG TPA: hypothetical protein PLM07_19045 [Candidatus Rifleibacterium sp.]|nr:hypothetical protein [Candidatus Rifleibacterium sp.]HPT47983.1 hypothetical protein [Candidatus Rifleibacterium sp.]
MKITGREFLQALDEFFSKSNSSTEIFLLLILPALLISIGLLLYDVKKKKAQNDPFFNMSKTDFEVLEHIRLQKGLEEFDRDFLINIAFTYSIKPTRMLLDQATFERIEEMMTEKLKKIGANPAENKSLEYLKSVKSKLFK